MSSKTSKEAHPIAVRLAVMAERAGFVMGDAEWDSHLPTTYSSYYHIEGKLELFITSDSATVYHYTNDIYIPNNDLIATAMYDDDKALAIIYLLLKTVGPSDDTQ